MPKKAIVGLFLSQSPADQTQLPQALREIKATTGRQPDQMVVDAGFTTREAILTTEEKGIEFIGSMTDPFTGRRRLGSLCRQGISEAFYPERFRFDLERQCCICPEGKSLFQRGESVKRGKTIYYYKGEKCGACPSKLSCCPKAGNRTLSRIENDPRVDAFIEKMHTDEAKAIYKQRGEVAEFPIPGSRQSSVYGKGTH